MEAPYTPEKYVEAIKEAVSAGYKVLIIDSLTHDWTYCLDLVSNMPGNEHVHKMEARHAPPRRLSVTDPSVPHPHRRDLLWTLIKNAGARIKPMGSGVFAFSSFPKSPPVSRLCGFAPSPV